VEEPVEVLGAAIHVIGDSGPAVEKQRRRAVAAAVPAQHAVTDGDLERLLTHGATLATG